MQKRRVVGVSPLDAQHKKMKPPIMGGIQLKANIRISRPPEVCYRYWRDFKNLSTILSHLDSVTVIDDRLSHWMVAAPADTSVEWDAEIIEDLPNERISWRSLQNAQIDNAGSVHFSPQEAGRQTELKVALTYNPTLGIVGNGLAKLIGESPDQELADDLVRFKEAVEKGG